MRFILWFSKSSDASVQRFDKSLEEFYALCDQLELCLVGFTHTTNILAVCCLIVQALFRTPH